MRDFFEEVLSVEDSVPKFESQTLRISCAELSHATHITCNALATDVSAVVFESTLVGQSTIKQCAWLTVVGARSLIKGPDVQTGSMYCAGKPHSMFQAQQTNVSATTVESHVPSRSI